jgi:aspartate kinase
MMPLLVMKFGGTSVADLDRASANAPKRSRARSARGYDVIVIVSAMAGKTNELVGWVDDLALLRRARIRRGGRRARTSPPG